LLQGRVEPQSLAQASWCIAGSDADSHDGDTSAAKHDLDEDIALLPVCTRSSTPNPSYFKYPVPRA